MKIKTLVIGALSVCLFGTATINAQTIPKDELIFLTASWKGERFADGRPRIPDELLKRAAKINIDDAWTCPYCYVYAITT